MNSECFTFNVKGKEDSQCGSNSKSKACIQALFDTVASLSDRLTALEVRTCDGFAQLWVDGQGCVELTCESEIPRAQCSWNNLNDDQRAKATPCYELGEGWVVGESKLVRPCVAWNEARPDLEAGRCVLAQPGGSTQQDTYNTLGNDELYSGGNNPIEELNRMYNLRIFRSDPLQVCEKELEVCDGMAVGTVTICKNHMAQGSTACNLVCVRQ